MKVVALDVDGVLNQINPNGWNIVTPRNERSIGPFVVDPALVSMFNAWALEHGFKVVVSSTWRSVLPNVSENFDLYTGMVTGTAELFCRMTGVEPSLILEDWRTPKFGGIQQRIFEIDDWRERHPEVERIVAIDDMPMREPWFTSPNEYLGPVRNVVTNPLVGITEEKLAEAYVLLTSDIIIDIPSRAQGFTA